jgi:NAD(P)-dependent dehydrogenase (short-subunit alcohol dehydrogenase family)
MKNSSSNLPERIFDWAVQEQFSQLSGDRNPMHMDAVAARRTHAGQPVVHGIHAVLWAMETLAGKGDLQHPISRIKVRFQKLIYVGDAVTLKIVRQDIAGISLHVCVDELPVSSIDIGFGEPLYGVVRENSPDATPPSGWPEEPANLSLTQVEQATGCLAFAQNVEAAEHSFPGLSAAIGSRRVSALACMSRLVGMVCPGMHSTFFSLTVRTIEPPEPKEAIRYGVTSVHDQFRLVKQTVEGGGWSGTIESIVRIPPVAQSSLGALAGLVDGSEFQETSALIIGGSRGLGELTAKLIVAGGGAVTITYSIGRDDAIEVQRQIREWGGKCEVLQYDATLPATSQFAHLDSTPTSLYYFATTPIFVRKTRLYTPAVFEKFYRVYAEGFYEVCTTTLRDSKPGSSVFFPSSVAVEDHPLDMTEYAMAKAAGEILCGDLARSKEGFRFIVERLPRMLTDQTASVMPVKTIDPLEVMLPIVRRMEGRGNS